MARFTDSWMQELLARNDIVDLVGEYVQLKLSGGRHWGLCPFHDEKTPSFSVSQDKQLFYCFSCHAGGTALQFTMKAENLSFPEAVEHLAQRVNLELPDEIEDKTLRQEAQRQKRILSANKEAARFYHKMLREGDEAARQYLEYRGISVSTAVNFGLGYAHKQWDSLTKHLKAAGFTESELLLAGLSRKRNDNIYDNFRDRLIFPIISPGSQKKVLAFGGRSLGDGEPKYLNTSETPVFNKRRHLFGMNLIASSVSSLVLVEGYMDVVSLHQSGIKNAVASLGTALTQQQARLIKRYTENVFVAYDGDSAGQNAALRGMEILKQEGLDVRIVEFPDGLDPDDFVRQQGKQAFDLLCDQACTLVEFKLKRIAAQNDLSSENGRESLARDGAAYISRLSPIEQERYFPFLARLSGYSVGALRQEIAGITENDRGNRDENRFGKNRVGNNRNTKGKQPPEVGKERMIVEQELIQLVALDKAARDQVLSNAELFAYEPHKRFLGILAGRGESSIDITALLSEMDENDQAAISAALLKGSTQQPDVQLKTSSDAQLKTSLQRLKKIDLTEKRLQFLREADDDQTSSKRRSECYIKIKEINQQLDDIDNYENNFKNTDLILKK